MFLHEINFLKKTNSYLDAIVEQMCKDMHLRALYVLADFGGDQHAIDRDGRMLQGDQQESTVF